MLINGELSCWNMNNLPAIWRLHWRTHRVTDCTFPLPSGRSDVAAKRLLHTTSTFSQSLMVSVGVSKLGHTGLKISSLESRWMEPTTVTFCCCNICYRTDSHVAGEFFIFQLDSAPAHRAHETILNARLLLSFCWICSRWTAQTSIQLTIKFRAWCSNESTRRKCRSWTIWGSINSGWRDAMEQGVIDSAINQWRRHRRACVQAKGGHFEYCDLLFSLICTVKICR